MGMFHGDETGMMVKVTGNMNSENTVNYLVMFLYHLHGQFMDWTNAPFHEPRLFNNGSTRKKLKR